MKIELKKISFNERMSEETNCFIADLYINGKKVGECKNDGRGGCTDFYGNSKENNQVIREADEYFKSLPKVKAEGYDFMYQPTLETEIDDQFEQYLKIREQKKMEKRMKTCILFGSPDEDRRTYSYYNFQRPLSSFPKHKLQASVARIKDKLKAGEVILNTNLEALGITV